MEKINAISSPIMMFKTCVHNVIINRMKSSRFVRLKTYKVCDPCQFVVPPV